MCTTEQVQFCPRSFFKYKSIVFLLHAMQSTCRVSLVALLLMFRIAEVYNVWVYSEDLFPSNIAMHFLYEETKTTLTQGGSNYMFTAFWCHNENAPGAGCIPRDASQPLCLESRPPASSCEHNPADMQEATGRFSATTYLPHASPAVGSCSSLM